MNELEYLNGLYHFFGLCFKLILLAICVFSGIGVLQVLERNLFIKGQDKRNVRSGN